MSRVRGNQKKRDERANRTIFEALRAEAGHQARVTKGINMAKCVHDDCDAMRPIKVNGEIDHYKCKGCGWESPSRRDFQKSNKDIIWDQAFDAFERFMTGRP